MKNKSWKVHIGDMIYTVDVIDDTLLMSYSFGTKRLDHIPTHEDARQFIVERLSKK